MSNNPKIIWKWPITLGVLVASGLISALVSESWGDVWSWLVLGLPVCMMTWFSCRQS
jgi:uncharacterized membrane protein YjjP (DUF1212 family)